MNTMVVKSDSGFILAYFPSKKKAQEYANEELEGIGIKYFLIRPNKAWAKHYGKSPMWICERMVGKFLKDFPRGYMWEHCD